MCVCVLFTCLLFVCFSIGRSAHNKQIMALEIDVIQKEDMARPSVAIIGGLGNSDRAAKEIVVKFSKYVIFCLIFWKYLIK